jgi:hypothetical protein
MARALSLFPINVMLIIHKKKKKKKEDNIMSGLEGFEKTRKSAVREELGLVGETLTYYSTFFLFFVLVKHLLHLCLFIF